MYCFYCTRQILFVLMQWESKHVRQKHFRLYLLAICRVLPKHNAQRPSKERKDWTLDKNKNGTESTVEFTKLRFFAFIAVMIVLFENYFLCMQKSYKHLHQLKLYMIMSLKYNWHGTCKQYSHVQNSFSGFLILLKAWKGSISPLWFQEPKQGNILLFK